MWVVWRPRTNAKSWCHTEAQAVRLARDRMVALMMEQDDGVVGSAMLKVCGSTRIPDNLNELLDRGLLDRKVRRLAEYIGRTVHDDKTALVWYVDEEESEWEDDEW